MTTPMMQQWHACKEQAKDALLLFRLGDFYEAFYDDAQKLSDLLGLTLTKRQGTPMSGIPFHSAEKYLEKLIEKGECVAIAEQIENPKEVKGIVKRKIVRTLSPGTVFSDSMLKEKQNNYFAALSSVGKTFGLAYVDLSTGEFRVIECASVEDLVQETERIAPTEILIAKPLAKLCPHLPGRVTHGEAWRFDFENASIFLAKHFHVAGLDGFGLKEWRGSIAAAGALLHYLSGELLLPIDHIKRIERVTSSAYMSIDTTTAAHLELFEKKGFLDTINHARTPMGARLMRQWVQNPLLSMEKIKARQECIEALKQNPFHLFELLHAIRDIDRLITRCTTKNGSPRDLLGLKLSLVPLPAIKTEIKKYDAPLLQKIENGIDELTDVSQLIEKGIVENPPLRLSDGGIIATGYDAELDELRSVKENAQQWLADYQEKLRIETGIKTLKVGFTKAFGYYIDVTRANSHLMPISFHKRQTLVNNERFISEELKIFEEKIFRAEETIQEIEEKLYRDILQKVCAQEEAIRKSARAIAHLDALASLTTLAMQAGYTKPEIDESDTLHIEEGRHPVLEMRLQEQFIPNNVTLNDAERLVILTGPNMAGKSTYIRQVALIVLLAQIGSYVPATHATVGIVDKLFTRIGASDDLARGQSTFMVEMCETANILHGATDRSLVILDEIGRGTSTYDGISIAWAVAEALLDKGAKTLFATHYFELTELESDKDGAINYTVAVAEEEEIVFLHKIVRGSTDKSYGIHVAKLAGMPGSVILRAKELLKQLETKKIEKKEKNSHEEPRLKKESHPIVNEMNKIDPGHMTPIEALQFLIKLKNFS